MREADVAARHPPPRRQRRHRRPPHSCLPPTAASFLAVDGVVVGCVAGLVGAGSRLPRRARPRPARRSAHVGRREGRYLVVSAITSFAGSPVTWPSTHRLETCRRRHRLGRQPASTQNRPLPDGEPVRRQSPSWRQGGGCRQPDGHGDAPGGWRVDADRAAVGGDQLADDRQTDPGASCSRRVTAAPQPVEPRDGLVRAHRGFRDVPGAPVGVTRVAHRKFSVGRTQLIAGGE